MKTEDTLKTSDYAGTVQLNYGDNSDANATQPSVMGKKKGVPTLVQVGAAGISGLALGAVAMTLVSGREADDEVTDIEFAETVEPEGIVPDGSIEFAEGVNDEMSFADAFAAARAEVGAGGAFVWHGEVYGTYTAAEWNAMSEEQQQEWGSHFTWNQGENQETEGNDDDGRGGPEEVTGEQENEVRGGEQEQQTPQVQEQQTPQVQEQQTPEVQEQQQTPQVQEQQPASQVEEPGTDVIDEPAGEIVVQPIDMDDFIGLDSGTDGDAQYVTGLVDGHQAIAIDVDSDGIIDVVAVDYNDNDTPDTDEFFQPEDTTGFDDLI